MYRQIVTPDKRKLILQLPAEFVGHAVEITAKAIKRKRNKKYSLEENKKFYNKFRFTTFHLKFNRDELYDR